MSDINIKETTKFDSVTSFLDSSLTKLGKYSEKLAAIGSGLTGELLSTYNSAASPVKAKISSIESNINSAKSHINVSLAICNVTDEKLKDKLDNILDYIFSNDDLSYLLSDIENKDGETITLSFEERCERIENVANMLYEQFEALNKAYKELYGNGVAYDAKKAYRLLKIFDALGVFIDNDDVGTSLRGDFGTYHPLDGSGDENVYLGKNSLLTLFDWCNDNDVIPTLKNYINGSSWESSGMEKLFGESLRKMDEDTYNLFFNVDLELDSLDESEYAETIFMYRYLNDTGGIMNGHNDRLLTSDFKDYINSKNFSYDNIFESDIIEEDFDSLAKFKYRKINDLDTARTMLKDFLKDENLFETYDNLQVESLTCDQLEKDIAVYGQMAYDYRFNGKAMAYETDKNNPNYDYKSYLSRDYSDTSKLLDNHEYLSQDEIALYMMYKDKDGIGKANDYLNSLSDRITSRKSMEKVEKTLLRWNENGGDIIDYLDSGGMAFLNGLSSFTQNISSIFGTGQRSESDYVNMYMLSYLSNENNYTENFSPEFRELLKNNYEVMTSVGSATIPVVLSFVPGGRAVGAGLSSVSAAGTKYKYAMQTGSTTADAYGYSILSGLSNTAFMYLLSGIAGVNGSNEALKSFSGWAIGNARSFGSAFMGSYVDAGLKSWVLGETFDFDKISDEALHNAFIAAESTGIINAGTTVGIKAANSEVGQRVIAKLKDIFMNEDGTFKLGLSTTDVNGNNPKNKKEKIIIIDENGDPQDITYHEDGYLTFKERNGVYERSISGNHLITGELIDAVTGEVVTDVEVGGVYKYTNGNGYPVMFEVKAKDPSGVFDADVAMLSRDGNVNSQTFLSKTFWPVGADGDFVSEHAQMAYDSSTSTVRENIYNGIKTRVPVSNSGFPMTAHPICMTPRKN